MELIHKYFPGLTARQLEQLEQLKPLYEEWNAQINVISRKDVEYLYLKHVLHALSIARIAPFPAGTTVMDIGTGGGFPGIPLAIFFPEVHFHLVDSIGKKIKVVSAVSEALALDNVRTAHQRAEDVRLPPFDFIVTRAVASLDKLCRWGFPHLKKKKQLPYTPALICLKGGDLAAEISASGRHPKQYAIGHYFKEDYFFEKYVLVVER